VLPEAAAERQVRPVHLAFIAIVVGLLLFPSIQHGDLSGYDDAFYAHEAREMVQSGDWLSVRYNGNLNFEYPPMFFWMEAVSLRVFGFEDYAAKLPAAITGLGTVLVLFFLAQEMTGDRWLAFLSMFVLGSTQYFLKYSEHAMTDVPFTFFFTLAMLFYLKGLRRPRWLLLFGIFVSLALMTRPIIGILEVFVAAIHLVLSGKGRVLLSPYWIGGCLLALVLPVAWGASQVALYGSRFLEGHLAVFTQRASEGGRLSPAVFDYFWLLLRHYWPWLPALLIGLGLQFRALWQRREVPAALALIWFATVVVPFSLVEPKYARYLIPAFPALSIISAIGINHWIPERRRSIVMNAGCVLLLAAGLVFQFFFPPRERATDMRILAPVATAHSNPDDRVLLYTFGSTGYDYQNQLLWYGDRYTELFTDLDALAERLEDTGGSVGVIDQPSFEVLAARIGDGRRLEVVGTSDGFLCYRVAE